MPLISFPNIQTLYSSKSIVAPKNGVPQSSRKATRSTSQGSTAASTASGGVVARSIAKAAAITAIEQPVVTVPSNSHKIQNFNSKVSHGVDPSATQALKQKSIVVFNIPQIIPRGIEELQAHINPTFQPFGLEDDGYSSSKSFTATPKESPSSHVEVKSSDTVVMLVMVTEAANIEEQLASMKATLDRFSKESAEKDAQIKH